MEIEKKRLIPNSEIFLFQDYHGTIEHLYFLDKSVGIQIMVFKVSQNILLKQVQNNLEERETVLNKNRTILCN